MHLKVTSRNNGFLYNKFKLNFVYCCHINGDMHITAGKCST